MKFRDFAPYVQPEVPGAPLFQVDMAVREAAISLLSRADLWRAEPQTVLLTAGQTEFSLDAAAGSEPSRVVALHRAGRPLNKVAREEDAYAILDSRQPSTATHYFQRDNEAVIVAPAPKEADQLKLFLSLKPSATATSIPDGIGKEWRKLIATGAKAELQLMAGQPWSNPQQGLLNKQLFERGVSAAIRRVAMGNSGAPLTVQKRDFI